MNKPWMTHYKNKYPQGRVIASDNAMDVFNAAGEHAVALRKNGAGQWQCMSAELGCVDCHDLAPIPKNTRVHKLYPNGMIAPSEEAKERTAVRDALAKDSLGGVGKVPSIDDLMKAGRGAELSGESDKVHNMSWKAGK